MSTWRKLVVSFWVLIGILLLWNFHSYNAGLDEQAKEHPVQQHFYFLHTNAPASIAPTHRDGPDVQQTSFAVQPGTPAAGSFTCVITLKNVGNVKAKNIQIQVRPYRGVSNLDVDVGGGHGGPLAESDPISQINDWVSFPDLGPGESATENDTWVDRTDIHPGANPTPQIIFQADKPPPPPPRHPAD